MIQVNSEIGRLKQVIIHQPDEGIARIDPKRSEELLFDDIVHFPLLLNEYSVFKNLLVHFLGAENVLETQKLLQQSLSTNTKFRKEFIYMVLDFEELPQKYFSVLNEMDDFDLSHLLISGFHSNIDRVFFDPIPNFIFTRDIATVVNDYIIIAKAAKKARHRENLLSRFIFHAHPMFKSTVENKKIINLNDIELYPPSKKGEYVTLEGGDMMTFDQNNFLIGCSERSSPHAFESIKNTLLDQDIIKNVVKVNIPNDRSCMHIDTLFTRINHKDICCYKPTIFDGLGSNVEVYSKSKKRIYNSIKEFMFEEIDPNINFIFAGEGKSPYQEREQWTDGCNLVSLKPGVAISYDRNVKTEIAFQKAGYQIVRGEYLNQKFRDGSISPNDIENTIITIPSAELSRARGGSHCMTCPIIRDNV